MPKSAAVKATGDAIGGRAVGLEVHSAVGANAHRLAQRFLDDVRSLLGQRRVTIVFDRGGWSPKLFQRLIALGFDILTYRKGRSRPVPLRCFHEHKGAFDGRKVRYQLDDRNILLLGRKLRLRLRQVTRLKDGHQTQIVTSRRDLTAIEVAYREVPSHPEGVWFVDLSPIADEVALPGAFATALRLAISTGTEPREQIATYIASRDALLVVDNCEHVIDPVAEFVDALLERSPRLRVIATSRESLEIEGEFTWKVLSALRSEFGGHAEKKA